MQIKKLEIEEYKKKAIAPTLTTKGWLYLVCNVAKAGEAEIATACFDDEKYLSFDLVTGLQIVSKLYKGDDGIKELAHRLENYALIVNNEPTRSIDQQVKEQIYQNAIKKHGEKPPVIWVDDNKEGDKIIQKLVTGKAISNNA